MAARFAPAPDPLEGLSLPGWVYHDPDYFAAEMARVIRPSWQIVCHVSDLASEGDWRTLDYLGESVLVARGGDGVIRAFANLCRHRGSRLVDGAEGCASRFTCRYHAWSYALDGRLIGFPGQADYPDISAETLGLNPVDLEIWNGFVFVRLEGGGPSVAEMLAPCEAELAPYRFADMRATGRVTLRPRAVNWKTVSDNYSDGLHITIAHPGLTRLFGGKFNMIAEPWVDRMWGEITERPSAQLSERAYQAFLPPAHPSGPSARRWLYLRLWPNVAFDIYPDQVDFMQFIPVSPTETLIREIPYALPDDSREMRAARYLNWRINRQVNVEDTAIINSVQQGMASASYTPGPLGESEVCLRHFNRKLRAIMPEARLDSPPKRSNQ